MNFKTTYKELLDAPERYTEFSRFAEMADKPLPVLLWHFLHNDREFLRGKCKNCEERTKFISFKWGYKTFCSPKCSNDFNREKIKRILKERYGHEHPFKNPDILKKSKKTLKEKYGDENFAKSEKFRKTLKENNLKKYGVDHHNKHQTNKDKILKSWMINWGKKNPALHPLVKAKIKNTLMERYGVDHPRYAHLDPELVDVLHSKTWWQQIYSDDGYTIKEIAKETGLSIDFIRKKLKEYGLVISNTTNPTQADEIFGGIF